MEGPQACESPTHSILLNLCLFRLIFRVWWYKPVILALGRLQQEAQEFEISLRYMVKQSQATRDPISTKR